MMMVLGQEIAWMTKIGVLQFVMNHRSHVGVKTQKRIVTNDVMSVHQHQERTEIGVVGAAVVQELTIADVLMIGHLGEVDQAGVTESATRNVVALQVVARMTGEGKSEIDLGRIVIDSGEIMMTGGHQCVTLIVRVEIVTSTVVSGIMTGLVTVILIAHHVTTTGGIVISIDLVTVTWIVVAHGTLIVLGHVTVHEILSGLVTHSRGHSVILSGHRGTRMTIKAEIVVVALAETEIEMTGQLPEMIGVAEKQKSHELRRSRRNRLVTERKVALIVTLTKMDGRRSNISVDDT